MSSPFSQAVMKIRAEAGVLDVALLEVSEAESRYLSAAVTRAANLSDDALERELEKLNNKMEAYV